MAMRVMRGIKPQDVLVLLKIMLWEKKPWRHMDLAEELGLSQAEVSFALERCRRAGLLDSSKKKILRFPILDFLVYGLRYVYPAQPGPLCRGMPTAHSAPPLSQMIVSDEHDQYVWPWDEGTVRGQAIEPLYESVPFAAKRDPKLYEFLAMVDALRVGRARERALALQEIKRRFTGSKRHSNNNEKP